MSLSDNAKNDKDPKKIADMRKEVLMAIEKEAEIEKIKEKKEKAEAVASRAEQTKKRMNKMNKKIAALKQIKKNLKKIIKTKLPFISAAVKTTTDKKTAAARRSNYEQHRLNKNKEKKNKKLTNCFITGLLITMFIGLILLITFFYLPKYDGAIVRIIGKVIPFPAIIIEDKFISYDDYMAEVDLVEKALINQKKNGIVRKTLTHNQIKKMIADYLIDYAVVAKLSRKNNITINQREIDKEISQIKQQTRSEDSLDKILRKMYGWDQKDFETKILKPHLIKQKLAKKLFPNLIDEKELKKMLDKKIKEEEQNMNIYILTR